MYTNNKRILRLLVIAIMMNFVLFSSAYFLNLPLWLDTTGTIYVSCILGSPAGFLAAIFNNVTQAIFFYGEQSLFYYFVSLLTAYVAGTVAQKYDGRKKKWMVMTLVLIVMDSLSAVIITFLADKGVPSNYWSRYLYDRMKNGGIKGDFATVGAVLAVKIPDIIVSVLIVIVFIRITPKKLKDTNIVVMKSLEEIR